MPSRPLCKVHIFPALFNTPLYTVYEHIIHMVVCDPFLSLLGEHQICTVHSHK